MTIIGTRPEIIKLSRVIAELENHVDHILVHTGQNFDYELNQIFFNELGIKFPDYYLDCVGKTTAHTIGNIIAKSDRIMEKEKPEALLLYGDTNSCLSAIPAKRRHIPIFHMEAGNRCFDQRVPEEINRKIVDHLSDINMPLTEHARRYLLDEGIKSETIIKTGSTMKEVLDFYWPKIMDSEVLERLNLRTGEYFVVSAHREENLDYEENFISLFETLNSIADKYKKEIIFSTHPRTRKKLSELNVKSFNQKINFLQPLGFFDYIKLQKNAYCVISDSGTITEECSILDFPAVTIRQAHERPEGMDQGSLIMCGLKRERVIQSIDIVTSQHKGYQFGIVPDYNADNVSKKVLRIITSYIDYINKRIWHKN